MEQSSGRKFMEELAGHEMFTGALKKGGGPGGRLRLMF